MSAPRPLRVLVAVPYALLESPPWAYESLGMAINHARARGFEVSDPLSLRGQHVDANRNAACAEAHRSGADALWMVDGDTLVPPHALTALLSLNAPVASGVVVLGQEPFAPSVFRLMTSPERRRWLTKEEQRDRVGLLPVWPLPPEPIPVDAVGGACLLIRRPVWTALAPLPFRTVNWGSVRVGEDIHFCLRVREQKLGPIVVHPDVVCGHGRVVHLGRKTWEEHGSEAFEVGLPVVDSTKRPPTLPVRPSAIPVG